MNNNLNLNSPIRAVIVKVLSFDPQKDPVFGRTHEKDVIFKDLLTLGFDFYELLELFVNCDAVNNNSVVNIVENIPHSQTITKFTEKEFRTLIPHWTASKYHSASLDDLRLELKSRIEKSQEGAFVYNSNLNLKSKKAYNDTYILIVTETDKYFFDINRKKAFRIRF